MSAVGAILFFDNTGNTYTYRRTLSSRERAGAKAGNPALAGLDQSAILAGTVTMTGDATVYTQSSTTGKLIHNGIISGGFNLTAQGLERPAH